MYKYSHTDIIKNIFRKSNNNNTRNEHGKRKEGEKFTKGGEATHNDDPITTIQDLFDPI